MAQFKNLKIAAKLNVIFITMAVMLILAIGYLVIRISTQNVISQIKEMYIREAADHMRAIDIIMDKNYHQIQSFAQNEVFTSGTGTPEEMTAFLKKRKEIYGYTSLSYFDMNRIRIADTEGLHIKKRHQMARYWEDVLSGKVSAGSDVRIAEELKRPIIYFASPVKNADGKAIGVVVARFNPEDISRIIEEIIRGNEGEATLIDKDGNILYSTCEKQKKLVLKEKIIEMPSVKSAIAGKEGVTMEYSPYCKKEVFTVYTNEKGWHDFKGNGWILLISIEKDKALAPIQPLKNAIIGVLILAMFAALIIGPLAARYITQPIIKLNKTAQKIKDGDLTQRAEVTSYDEVGQLAIVFNQMVENLKKSYNGLAAYSKDLETKIKERTKELEEANAGLEEKVAERTKELKDKYDELTRSQTAMLYMIEDLNRQAKELRDTQDKLVRSEKLAVIGQLASSVAHEIRNPLGVMKNVVYYFNMLGLGKENAEIKENLDILGKEIENVNNIIGDLLEFARIKKPISRPEDINVIVNEVLRALKVPGGIEVVTELGGSLPEVEADALQMRQVFYNLAANAIQAMDKSGTLTVSTRGQSTEDREQRAENLTGQSVLCTPVSVLLEHREHDGFVEISFTDTGSGISKENLSKIFEPLFSTKVKGTGLGLSVVASLIEGHNGKIEVESEIGKGSTFTVKLPGKKEQQ